MLHIPKSIGSMTLKRRIYERQCTRIIQRSIVFLFNSDLLSFIRLWQEPIHVPICAPSLSLSSHPSDSPPSSIQPSQSLHGFFRIICIHGQERRGISIQLWVSLEGLPFRVLSHCFVLGSSSRPINKMPDGSVQERHLLLEICFWHSTALIYYDGLWERKPSLNNLPDASSQECISHQLVNDFDEPVTSSGPRFASSIIHDSFDPSS